jgi:SAM-dependent methyltransferase
MLDDMTDSHATTGQITHTAADVYEEFFVPALFAQWPDQVLEASGITDGDDVLDVGCGTGVLAHAAARRLAGTGSVSGLDLNEGMLDVARRVDPSVTWRSGNAERLPFADGSFDRVLSQFALMFFADPTAALAEMARVSRGTLTVATWSRLDDSPGYAAMVDLLRRVFGDREADALIAPFSIGEPGRLRELLAPHLDGISVVRRGGTARFASIEAWVHTDVRGWTLTDMIDDDGYTELLAAAQLETAHLALDDGSVAFPAPALIGSGRVRSF